MTHTEGYRKEAHVLVAVGVALAAHLSIIWLFPFFPTIDGPAHVHLAHGMHAAMAGDAFYADFFEFNERITPNLLTELTLFALMSVAPPLVAEKVLLTVYFVGFAVVSLFAVRSIQPHAGPLALFVFFCSVSFPLGFGFYNFAFSTVVLLAWLAFWWRTRTHFTLRRVLGHAAFSLLCYGVHLFALGASLLAIAAVGLGVVVRDWFKKPRSGPRTLQWWGEFLRTHALAPLLGSLPALVLAAGFVLPRLPGTEQVGVYLSDMDLVFRLRALLSGASLAVFAPLEVVPVAAYVVGLIAFSYHFARRSENFWQGLPFAVAFFVFILLYFAMPFAFMVRWMPMRFQPLVFVMFALWAAALMPRQYPTRKVMVIGLGLVLIVSAVRLVAVSRLNDAFDEFVSVQDHIRPHSTLVALRLSRQGAGAGPFIQAGSHLATLTHSADLKNFQGQASEHPIQFKPGRSAYAALGGDAAIVAVPPRVDIMGYERNTGRPIDYVLLWGEEPDGREDATAALFAQIEEYYDLVAVSEPRGLQRLYRRRD